MGRATGAAVKAAAPEAAAAAKVPGATKVSGAVAKDFGGKRRKPPVPDPRQTHPGSEAARQRQAVEDVKDARTPEPDDQGDEHQDQGDEQSSAGGGSLPNPFAGMQGPATGGGFVLGLMVWAVVRAYIGNPGQPSGPDGVKRLLRAKFLNKTS